MRTGFLITFLTLIAVAGCAERSPISAPDPSAIGIPVAATEPTEVVPAATPVIELVVVPAATLRIVHKSIAGGMMGLMLFVYAIPEFLTFPDLQFILPVIFQVVLLITPILYLQSDVPHGLAEIMRINPLTYIVDGYREVFYNAAWPSAARNRTVRRSGAQTPGTSASAGRVPRRRESASIIRKIER